MDNGLKKGTAQQQFPADRQGCGFFGVYCLIVA